MVEMDNPTTVSTTISDDHAPIDALTTIMKGSSMWDVDESNPPILSSSSEPEETDIDEIQRVQQVETLLHQLVDQIPTQHDTTISKEVDQKFLEAPVTKLPVLLPHTYPCNDSYNVVPAAPIKWPQAPIMLRPTPNTQMVIRGIRYANSRTYQNFPGLCAGCILPINTGYEIPGQSYVIDFESPLFIGTLLVRVKGAKPICFSNSNAFLPGATAAKSALEDTNLSTYYFDGKKRQFQVIVKGRFKRENIPMSECVTGQAFDRPAGKLPARLIVNTFIKFIATLAPQLEVELDSHRPRFLSPLVATAHTVIVDASLRAPGNIFVKQTKNNKSEETLLEDKIVIDQYDGSSTMEDDVEEPPSDDPSSVMATLPSAMRNARSGSTTIVQRRATRKKAFNRLAAAGDYEHVFDVNKEYTFEFFQHLLLLSEPDEFKINMGHNIQIGLTKALNGQPIKILAARRRAKHGLPDNNANSSIAEVLWSFDLWHQSLYTTSIDES